MTVIEPSNRDLVVVRWRKRLEIVTIDKMTAESLKRHKHRIWMDLDGTLATFGSEGELKSRVYFE